MSSRGPGAVALDQKEAGVAPSGETFLGGHVAWTGLLTCSVLSDSPWEESKPVIRVGILGYCAELGRGRSCENTGVWGWGEVGVVRILGFGAGER